MKKILFLIFLFFVTNCFAQKNAVQLEKKLLELYEVSNFPGFSVAIVDENGILFEKSYGLADIATKKNFTINSVQNIGSISKTFIGVALMKAIDLGYFNLNTNINDLLPFEVKNPKVGQNVITIKHLSNHTSGIVDDEKVYSTSFLKNDYSDKKSPLYSKFIKKSTIPNRDDVNLKDFLTNYFSKDGKWYKPSNFNSFEAGKEYNYSNIASALAAYLIELKSGRSYSDFCNQYIFKPLKMSSTSFELNDSLFSKHVKIYNAKKQYYPLYSEITYPDGSLKTSCEDLSIYLVEMIKGYNYKSNLLSKESFENLFKKHFDETNLPLNNDSKEPNSGVFWRYRKSGQIGHSGSDLGISTFMYFNPTTGIGKIFMTNIEFDYPYKDGVNEKLIEQFVTIWKTLDEY